MKRVHLPLDWIGTPTWPPFHSVLETQYGNRDVMWRSIASSTLNLNTACSINMVASFQNKEYRLVYCYWKHKSDITQNIITWKKVLKQAISQKRITYTPFHSSQHLKISVKTRIVLFCYSSRNIQVFFIASYFSMRNIVNIRKNLVLSEIQFILHKTVVNYDKVFFFFFFITKILSSEILIPLYVRPIR